MSLAEAASSDEIRVFLPGIGEEEHARRAKLRSLRNAASSMLATARCDTARQLAWMVIEWGSPNLYAPAPIDWLDKLNLLCTRLLITATQAEDMALECQEASDV